MALNELICQLMNPARYFSFFHGFQRKIMAILLPPFAAHKNNSV